MCEDYCRIENKKFRRPHYPPPPVKVTTSKNRPVDPVLKQNKFEELEDLITTNNQEHREEIQKFLDQIEGFQKQCAQMTDLFKNSEAKMNIDK